MKQSLNEFRSDFLNSRSLQDQLRNLSSDNAALQQVREGQNTSITTLETQCSNLQAHLDEERKKLADSEQQLHDATAQVPDTSEIDSRLQVAEIELASLQAEKQDLERALEHLTQQEATGGTQLDLIRMENQNLKAEFSRVQEQIQKQDAEKDAAKREVSTTDRNILRSLTHV